MGKSQRPEDDEELPMIQTVSLGNTIQLCSYVTALVAEKF
jgi:hypothetical protein